MKKLLFVPLIALLSCSEIATEEKENVKNILKEKSKEQIVENINNAETPQDGVRVATNEIIDSLKQHYKQRLIDSLNSKLSK